MADMRILTAVEKFFLGNSTEYDLEFNRKEMANAAKLAYIASAFFVTWSIIDYYLARDILLYLLSVRVGTSLVIVNLVRFGFNAGGMKGALAKFLVFFIFSISGGYIICEIPDKNSPLMLAGLVLVNFSISSLLLWRTRVYILWGLLVIVSHCGMVYYYKNTLEFALSVLVDLTTVTLGVMFTILNERNLRADFNNRKAIQEQKDKIETASMELNSVFATIHESIISFDHGLKIKIASNELEKVFGRINDVASLIEKFEIDKDNISLCLESLRSIAGESEINKTINEQHLLKNCRYRGRSYTLNWTFIYDHQDVCVGGVVSISDETEKILKESIEEAANQKADRMMTKIKTLINGNIKSGQLFLKESLNLVTDLLDLADLSRVDRHPVLLRNVHTIKGAGRVLKMNDVKLLAHEIESSYKEGQYPDVRSKCSLLISELKEYNQALDSFLVGEVRTLSIFDVVHSLKDDFTERLRAARIGYRGLSVSDELGPVPHEIKECILHGLTNAVDHGFILPSARGLSVNAAFIKVECRREGGLNFVFIRDNGVGIDWEKIRDICRKKGYAAKPDRPATDVLFLDGVTTAAEVSTTSGRGIGMGAIKDAVEAIGGDVKLVDNDQNHGSMLVISWPVEGRVAFHADGKVVA